MPATVQATDDVDDYDLSQPTNWAGKNGVLSLPEAIREVNKIGGSIDFGVTEVTLTKPLLPLTRSVVITGQTAGNGAPGTIIDGGNQTGGITLSKGGAVRNLVIQHFGGDALLILGAATIENNYIGTDVSGLSAVGNGGVGINISGPGCTVKNNVIGGNAGEGIEITSNNNKVIGNKIGLGADGTTHVPNERGIVLGSGARFNTIGGTTPAARNLISANAIDGIWMQQADSNRVLGNYIGVDQTGTTSAGNTGGDGIKLEGSSSNSIGGTTAASRNIIGANDGVGVRIVNFNDGFGDIVAAQHNTVAGNFIGLNTAEGIAGNVEGGVDISGGALNNTIGGASATAGNVISFNGGPGVSIRGTGTRNNLVAGNKIGADSTGNSAKANNGDGVIIAFGAAANTVGGSSAAGNVISSNQQNGIELIGTGVISNRILGNKIGTNAAGAAALGNGASGVLLHLGASSNTIGGTSASFRNLISGNGADGIDLVDANTVGNLIEGNFVGADASGLHAIGNAVNGISDSGSLTTIGGVSAGARNIVSGNNLTGISVEAQSTKVLGNYVGIDVTGKAALGNVEDGIFVANKDHVVIGNGSPGGRNVVAGNGVSEIRVDGRATNTLIQGNYIGTSAAGTAALGKAIGIWVRDSTTGTTIGGTAVNNGNLISGNGQEGVKLDGPAMLFRNYIGTDYTGRKSLANGGAGVLINASGVQINTLTTPTAFNVIAFNGGDGIHLVSGGNNVFSENLIFNNSGLGIRLDAGANFNIATPAVSSISTAGGAITVTGTIPGMANHSVRLELFGNPQPDPSGFGEGTLFLGALANVALDGSGKFVAKFARGVPFGYRALALTVTDSNDTSAFSNTVIV